MRYEDGGQTIYAAKSLYDPEPTVTLKTAMFREIGRPECDLMGVMHESLTRYAQPLDFTVVTAADPWFAGTGFQPGDIVRGIVGREYDVISPWGGCNHPDTTVLFHYQGAPGRQSADALRFTFAGGARVFAAGAQRFTWGLDDWRSSLDAYPPVPADPRLQQFMRNALDDLTRPAPPSGLAIARSDTTVTVTVAASTDPRALGFVAARREGGRWLRVCRGVTSCTGVVPAGPVKLAVVAVDRWQRRSAIDFATG
jgi:hypothetical protein